MHVSVNTITHERNSSKQPKPQAKEFSWVAEARWYVSKTVKAPSMIPLERNER